MGASFRPNDEHDPDEGIVAEINITPLTDVFLVLTVSPGGEILVDDQPTSEANLYAVLEAALAESREKLVILRGDKQVFLGKAVSILDLAQKAGATGIALATKPPPKKS
jgi:biopolymer transport protein ExbD